MPRNDMPWNKFEERAFSQFKTPNELATALSSNDVNKRESAIRAMKNIRHVNSSFLDWFDSEPYLLSRLDDIFFFGFQETLDEDFRRLKGKLGIPQHVALPTNDIQTHRTPKELDTELNKTAIMNVKSWYSQDYKFLQLCKQLSDKLD
jgi:hypothetical protein